MGFKKECGELDPASPVTERLKTFEVTNLPEGNWGIPSSDNGWYRNWTRLATDPASISTVMSPSSDSNRVAPFGVNATLTA